MVDKKKKGEGKGPKGFVHEEKEKETTDAHDAWMVLQEKMTKMMEKQGQSHSPTQ